MCVVYLSQVEESHWVAGVAVIDPAFLTRVEELHVPDLCFAFNNKTSHNVFEY